MFLICGDLFSSAMAHKCLALMSGVNKAKYQSIEGFEWY